MHSSNEKKEDTGIVALGESGPEPHAMSLPSWQARAKVGLVLCRKDLQIIACGRPLGGSLGGSLWLKLHLVRATTNMLLNKKQTEIPSTFQS